MERKRTKKITEKEKKAMGRKRKIAEERIWKGRMENGNIFKKKLPKKRKRKKKYYIRRKEKRSHKMTEEKRRRTMMRKDKAKIKK